MSEPRTVEATQRMLREALDLLSKATVGLEQYRLYLDEVLGVDDRDREETRLLLRDLKPHQVRAALREYRRKMRLPSTTRESMQVREVIVR